MVASTTDHSNFRRFNTTRFRNSIFYRWRCTNSQVESHRCHIQIDIRARIYQFVFMRLDPFGRPDDAKFFRAPSTEQDVALWQQALRSALCKGARCFHQHDCSCKWICRAKSPRIMMATNDNKRSVVGAPLQTSNDICSATNFSFLFDFHSHLKR